MNDLPRWVSFLPILIAMAIGVCTPFVMLGVALFFVRRRKLNAETNFTQLAASLGGRLHSSALNALPISTGQFNIRGRHHGVPYQLTYSGGDRYNRMPRIKLVIPVKPSFTLSLRKEDFDTRLSKQIGMATELEIGVPDFDAEYYIRTNDPTNCRNFLLIPKHRKAIRHIHRTGFMLAFTRKHILLSKYACAGFSPGTKIIEESDAKELLDAVVVLVKGL
jgi:hypothetical protein